jgi:hypothetical protein
METKLKPEKPNKTRQIVTIVVTLFILAALALAAQYLVSQVDIVELLKKLHGG